MTTPVECGYPTGSFWARYPGLCAADCGGQIIVGDAVLYNEDGELVHAVCQPKPDPDEPQRNERKCPACFTIHAGECL